jgi:hypothetical protein
VYGNFQVAYERRFVIDIRSMMRATTMQLYRRKRFTIQSFYHATGVYLIAGKQDDKVVLFKH